MVRVVSEKNEDLSLSYMFLNIQLLCK